METICGCAPNLFFIPVSVKGVADTYIDTYFATPVEAVAYGGGKVNSARRSCIHTQAHIGERSKLSKLEVGAHVSK